LFSHPSFVSFARTGLAVCGALLLCGSRAFAQHPDPRTVGVLETRAPAAPQFLLRGTLPLPPGVFPRADGRNPFRVLDHDGTPLLTQTEIVSRYPAEADGADVVELVARVRRDPALAVGVPARYAVVLDATQALPASSGVPRIVRDLVTDPTSIGIRATDCFGNVYVGRPLDGRGSSTVLQRGPVRGELRVYQELVPIAPVAGSTLPHLFGVHAYLSWSRGSTTVGLDLRFHNAHDGHDATTALDDPLGKLYFRNLEISVPESWRVLQDFDDPLSGAERRVNGRRFFALVQALPQGKLHVIQWQGQFHRRLALAPDRPADVAAARAQLDGIGRAFCVRGFLPGGREYWSWWNEATARYFPQRQRLPLLDHVPDSQLAAEIEGELQLLSTHLASGQSMGDYPISAPRLGWGHPWGVDYGGMTGGLEIYCYDGITAATLASPQGFRLYSALHRMQTDRMPNALYSKIGAPSSVEQWLVPDANGGYVPFEHWNRPQLGGSRPDPFGATTAPDFQIDFVAANGLKPGYESRHLGYDPYDFEHFVRYTRSAKVLAWLANDSLAKDDLCMQAENFHLSFHGHPNDAYNNSQSSGLLSMKRYVRTYPGQGSSFGRGQGWGLDCAVAAYSLMSPEWRARKLPWFRLQIQVLLESQPACNGFLQAIVSSKAVDGRYRARQAIEQSIGENALVGLHESVFRGADVQHAVMTRDVLIASLRGFISEMSWFPGQPGPWRYTGVGPISPDLPQWCSRSQMPPDAWSPGDIESYQDWSSLAYGYALTRDPLFLRHARYQIGGANFDDLHFRLENEGTNNIQNRAALLTVVQQVAGEL
jgi:hypothetical protein